MRTWCSERDICQCAQGDRTSVDQIAQLCEQPLEDWAIMAWEDQAGSVPWLIERYGARVHITIRRLQYDAEAGGHDPCMVLGSALTWLLYFVREVKRP